MNRRDCLGCCFPRCAADLSITAAPSTGGCSDVPVIRLPGGVFRMGSNALDAISAGGEGPVRPVRVRPFAMDAMAGRWRRRRSSATVNRKRNADTAPPMTASRPAIGRRVR